MSFTLSRDEFLSRNRISEERWSKADIAWEILVAIADDHVCKSLELSETAELCARVMQKLPGVHSVRWRVKDAEHLVEKIVRKLADEDSAPKYRDIGPNNYHSIVTDLIGLRALHLFKDDCFEIDAALRNSFILHQTEAPVAYVREGDSEGLRQRFKQSGLNVETHEAGYRSVHYVVSSQPLKRNTFVEVQVRTIFEEGWSEIDHKIRYPNFSDNPQIGLFLRIFNGLAGSADEMGSFVRDLVKALEENKRQISSAQENYEQTLNKLEATVAELDEAKNSNKSAGATVSKLKKELADVLAASAQAAHARAASAWVTPAELTRGSIGSLPIGAAFANSRRSFAEELNSNAWIGDIARSPLLTVQPVGPASWLSTSGLPGSGQASGVTVTAPPSGAINFAAPISPERPTSGQTFLVNIDGSAKLDKKS